MKDPNEDLIDFLINDRIHHYRQFGYGDVKALPEVSSEDYSMSDGEKLVISTYVQLIRGTKLLLCLQVARKQLFGIFSQHTERGLVFSEDGTVGNATIEDLYSNGGQL